MKQIPANSNDATTEHKLQGMTKDVIVVTSWPTRGLAAMFKNWEYVVLSWVHTLSGLYPVKPIDIKIIQTIFRTQEIRRKCKTKRNESARKTKTCNSTTKLAIIVCSNGQWQQDIITMEDNDGGEYDPTYIDQRTNGKGVVALFSGFENDA
jgi:hypothetical protein